MTEGKIEVDIAEKIRKILEKKIKRREQKRILNKEYPYSDELNEYEELLASLYRVFNESELPLYEYRREPDSHYPEDQKKDFENLTEEVVKWKEGEKESPLNHFTIDKSLWG